MNRATRTVGLLGVCALIWSCGPDTGPTDDPEPPVAAGIFGELGEPLSFATTEQLAAFERGHELVVRRWSPEEGLGPRFNVTFCGACHEKPVFGGSAARYRDFYLSASVLGDGSYITPPAAGIAHAYELEGELRRPGIEGNWTIQARRNPIPFFGVGLIAEIEESSILAHADPDDADGDGVSGRPNYDQGFVGRFGRKSQTVSIEGFIRGPLNNHLGITSDPLSEEQRARLPVDSSGQADGAAGGDQKGLRTLAQLQAAPPSEPLFDEDGVQDPELSTDELFDIVSFTMLLAAPRPDPPTPESESGSLLFEQTGCVSCHVRGLVSPRGLIPLYSDLLLHDMGEALADGLQMGLATGAEFRTQPLWGVAPVGPYLHDGSADTLDMAIRMHGGEGAHSRDAYLALTDTERLDVIAFLESLGGMTQRTDGLVPPDAVVPPVGALGGPTRALDASEEALWLEGRRIFDRDMFISEGLGPVFNGDSCRACHFEPSISGAGPIGVNVQHHGTLVAEVFEAPPTGTAIPRVTLPGVPRIEPTEGANVWEARQTPHTFGLGLIDGISEETILANADPDDADGDGISGRPHIVAGDRVGRFGWTAQVPSVREFIRDAMGAEIGLTVPEEAGLTYGAFSDADGVADPELSTLDLDASEFFLVTLSPPPSPSDPAAEAIFEQVGCAGCHIPSLEGADAEVPLYSDLLLHDVADDDYEGVPQGMATDREFRTPPLWGLSLSAPYMHDGTASTVEAAIEAHHGEASVSVTAFGELAAADRAALLEFLGEL